MFTPSEGDFIHNKMPNASKYRKASVSNTKSALIEVK